MIKAINRIKKEAPASLERMVLVGNVCPEFKGMIGKHKAGDNINLLGVVSSKEANIIASNSKALLVIEADMKESPFLPSKFADYAMAGRPILAITPKRSAVRDYLNRYGGGIAVTHNEEEIYQALKRLFVDNEKFDSSRLAGQFKPKTVANRYIEAFEAVISKKI